MTFEITARGDGSRLVLTDELPVGTAARNAAGWDECLAKLQRIAPVGSWQGRFERYAAEFQPAFGPQEGPPDEMKIEP